MKLCPCCKKERRVHGQLLCKPCWFHVPKEVRAAHLKTYRTHGPGSVPVRISARSILQNLRYSEVPA